MSLRLRKFYRENQVLVRFYLLFGYFLALLYLCLHFDWTHETIAVHLPEIVAKMVSGLLTFFGFSSRSYGTTITVLNGQPFRIIYHCTGLFLMAIYSSAVLAFPATWRQKAIGLVLGLPLLFVANLLRLVALGIAGRFSPELFDLSHEYLWQGVFVVLVLVLWAQWKRFFVVGPEPLVLDAK